MNLAVLNWIDSGPRDSNATDFEALAPDIDLLKGEPARGRVIELTLFVRLILPRGTIGGWGSHFIAEGRLMLDEFPFGRLLLFPLDFISPTAPVGPVDILRERSLAKGEGTSETSKGRGTMNVWVHTQGWDGGSLGGGAELLVDQIVVWRKTWQPSGPQASQRMRASLPFELV